MTTTASETAPNCFTVHDDLGLDALPKGTVFSDSDGDVYIVTDTGFDWVDEVAWRDGLLIPVGTTHINPLDYEPLVIENAAILGNDVPEPTAFKPGDRVVITDQPMSGTAGKVIDLDDAEPSVRVLTAMARLGGSEATFVVVQPTEPRTDGLGFLQVLTTDEGVELAEEVPAYEVGQAVLVNPIDDEFHYLVPGSIGAIIGFEDGHYRVVGLSVSTFREEGIVRLVGQAVRPEHIKALDLS